MYILFITILLKVYILFIGCYIIYQYIDILAVYIYSVMEVQERLPPC